MLARLNCSTVEEAEVWVGKNSRTGKGGGERFLIENEERHSHTMSQRPEQERPLHRPEQEKPMHRQDQEMPLQRPEQEKPMHRQDQEMPLRREEERPLKKVLHQEKTPWENIHR